MVTSECGQMSLHYEDVYVDEEKEGTGWRNVNVEKMERHRRRVSMIRCGTTRICMTTHRFNAD